MKTKIAIALCLLGMQGFAQKINSKDVPAAVRSGLEKSLQVKEAKWDREGDSYEANFKKGGKEMSALLDANGTLLETETEIAKGELPQAVQDVLKKDYAGFKLEEVAKITAKGVITYEVEVEKGETTFEMIFDHQGKLLKKEEEKEDRK